MKILLCLLILSCTSTGYSAANNKSDKRENLQETTSLKDCPLESLRAKTEQAQAVVEYYRQKDTFDRADKAAELAHKNWVHAVKYRKALAIPSDGNDQKQWDEIVGNAKKERDQAIKTRQTQEKKLAEAQARAVALNGLIKTEDGKEIGIAEDALNNLTCTASHTPHFPNPCDHSPRPPWCL